MNVSDFAVAVAGSAAIIAKDIRPVIRRTFFGNTLRLRVVDAAIDLSGAINVKAAALSCLIGAPAGNPLLAIDNVQAATLVIPSST
jgi:hypothetical protein